MVDWSSAKIFMHFTGFPMWDWDMDLGSSHHVSVVRGCSSGARNIHTIMLLNDDETLTVVNHCIKQLKFIYSEKATKFL